MGLIGTGFGFLLRDHDTIREALSGDISGVYLEMGDRLFALTDILTKYSMAIILDDMVSVADCYTLTDNSDKEKVVVDIDSEDWEIFNRTFIKKCTVQNVVTAVKQSLAKLRLCNKSEIESVRADALIDFNTALAVYIENM